MRFLFYFFLLVSGQFLYGQGVPIGYWKQHPASSGFVAVCNTGDYIYGGSNETLLRFSIYDNEARTLSKNEGLSDVGVSCLAHSTSEDVTIIGYSNGNIDLLKESTLINISAIRRSGTVLGSRKLNHITLSGPIAYISADFGLILLDLEKNEIREAAVNISPTAGQLQVNASCILNDSIYIATGTGILVAHIRSNLLDYSSWYLYKPSDGVPHDTEFISIVVHNNSIYALCNNKPVNSTATGSIYKLEEGYWQEDVLLGRKVNRMNIVDERILVGAEGCFFSYNDGLVDTVFVPGEIHDIVAGGTSLWLASSSGLLRFENQNNYHFVNLSSISASGTFRIVNENKVIFALFGGYNPNTTNWFRYQGMDIFEDLHWKNFSHFRGGGFEGIYDLVDVAYSHVNKSYYIASYGKGLLEFKDEKVTKVYDDLNSPLFNNIPGQGYVRVTEIEADPAGNIWIGNVVSNEAIPLLHKLSPDGTWTSYTLNLGISASVFLYKLRIDHKNNLWFTLRGRPGLYVYNPGNQGRKWRNIAENQGSGNLPNATVRSIEVDLNGDVWIGTDRGVAIFRAGSDPFAEDATIPYYDGLPLLMDKAINDIDVDGANRKWVATNDGVWLFNEDASEALEYFSARNSPLADSDIKDVEVSGMTGDVFMLTNYGVYSYRGSATETTEQGENKALVFPNPVRAGYDGLIGISGLARNASVKITDIYGNMVYETVATGGTAVWDGNKYNGQRAQSGVYLVFSATIHGDKGNIAKIVLIE